MSSSNVIPQNIQLEKERLVTASLSGNTHKRYNLGVESFTHFCKSTYCVMRWPPNVDQLTEYIAFMSLQNYSFSMIDGHISAISYVNKFNGWNDNTKVYIVKIMLEGLKRIRNQHDARYPVTQSLQCRLLEALPNVCRSQYETLLFPDVFTLTYVGLRISEFATKNKYSFSDVIQFDNVI